MLGGTSMSWEGYLEVEKTIYVLEEYKGVGTDIWVLGGISRCWEGYLCVGRDI